MFHLIHVVVILLLTSCFRFVRPSKMSEERVNEYIKGKYGKLGVDRYVHVQLYRK